MDQTQFGKRVSRRALLGGMAGTVSAAILAACGGETVATVAPTTAARAATTASGAGAAVGTTASNAGMTAGTTAAGAGMAVGTTASGAGMAAGTTAAGAGTVAATGATGAGTVIPTPAPMATVAPTAGATSAPAATTGATSATTAPAATTAATSAASMSPVLAGQSAFVARFQNTAGAGSPVDTVMIRQRTELTFYHTQSGPNEMALKGIVDAFNMANPNIVVNAQYVGSYNDVSAKLRADIQARKVPEIAVGYENDVANYMTGEAVLDLAPYINSKMYGWTREDLNDIFPGFLDRNLYRDFNNQILSAPFAASVLSMWYNNDMLKMLGFMAPPKTWDEFKRVADASVKAGKKGWPVNPDASLLDGMVFSFGGDVISMDNKKGAFDTPQALGALQVMEDMGKAGTMYQVKSNEDQTAFINGEVPFYIGSSTGRGFIQNLIYKDKNTPAAGDKFDWNGAVIPQGEMNLSSPKTALYGGNIIVFKSTPEKQLASWQFVKYFASKDATARWGQATGYLPVRKSAADSAEYKAFLAQKPVNMAPITIAPFGRGEPQPAGWSKSRNDISEVMVKLLNKQTTAREASGELQTKINRNLSE